MKSRNHQSVTRGYLVFSGYLAACIAVGVLVYFFFMQTSFTEVNRIVARTGDYDKIHAQQNELSDKISTLFLYVNQLNTDKNDKMLMTAVSDRKQEIMTFMSGIGKSDVKIHQQLMNDLDIFLETKDSIRIAQNDEEQIKKELRQCIEDNRQLSRKMKKGNMTVK
jgi:predicted PurR-regulated permease PerM